MSARWVPIGDVLQRRDDAVAVDPEAEYAMIGVLNRGRGVFERGVIRGHETKYARLSPLRRDDLIFSKLFAWEGSVGVVDREGWVSSEFPTYRIDKSQADVGYLAHVIGWQDFVDQLASSTSGLGQRRQRVAPARFEAAQIPLPDLDTQRSIAARLDAIAEMASALSTDAAGLKTVRGRLLLDSIEGAPEQTVGEVLELARLGVTPEAGERYRPIGVRSFGKGLIRYPETDADGLSKLAYFVLPDDCLVVSNIKAWEGAVTYYRGGENRITSSRFLCYTARRSDVSAEFLAEYFKTAEGVAKLAAASPGSADRNRTLGRTRFEQLRVPVPAHDVQVKVLAEAARFTQLADAYAHRQELQQALLPAARNEEFRKLLGR